MEGVPILLTGENKFIDKAVTGSKNTHWSNNGASVTTGASNTTVELDYTEYYQAEPLLVGDFEIQFNVSNFSGAIRFELYNSNNKRCVINTTTDGLYKFSRTNGVILCQRSVDNGENWTTLTGRETDTLTNEDCYFRFINYYNATRSFSYSDFKITYYSEYTSNTNSSGVATFSISDLSTSGVYTFEASYGSLTAECEVINAVFYDYATSEDTTKWSNQGVTATYGIDGTTLTNNTDYRYQLKNTSNLVVDNTIIEFDVYIPSGNDYNPQMYVRGQTLTFLKSDFSRDTWHHVKIVFDGALCQKYYYDGEYKFDITPTSQNNVFQFRTQNNVVLKFKNFAIYEK